MNKVSQLEFNPINHPLIQMENKKGEVIGKLIISDDEKSLTFEGNADEAANVFFEHVVFVSMQSHKDKDARIANLEAALKEIKTNKL